MNYLFRQIGDASETPIILGNGTDSNISNFLKRFCLFLELREFSRGSMYEPPEHIREKMASRPPGLGNKIGIYMDMRGLANHHVVEEGTYAFVLKRYAEHGMEPVAAISFDLTDGGVKVRNLDFETELGRAYYGSLLKDVLRDWAETYSLKINSAVPDITSFPLPMTGSFE